MILNAPWINDMSRAVRLIFPESSSNLYCLKTVFHCPVSINSLSKQTLFLNLYKAVIKLYPGDINTYGDIAQQIQRKNTIHLQSRPVSWRQKRGHGGICNRPVICCHAPWVHGKLEVGYISTESL